MQAKALPDYQVVTAGDRSSLQPDTSYLARDNNGDGGIVAVNGSQGDIMVAIVRRMPHFGTRNFRYSLAIIFSISP
ncbi:hypothetical protein J6590_000956 [Homalodisca vitripennis]|nr:hypothetical protein J6590_000956 [Homalodisca vitripennis]